MKSKLKQLSQQMTEAEAKQKKAELQAELEEKKSKLEKLSRNVNVISEVRSHYFFRWKFPLGVSYSLWGKVTTWGRFFPILFVVPLEFLAQFS